MSPATYYTYRDEQRTFEDIGVWSGGAVTVTGMEEPEQVEALSVTDGTLPILGIPPIRGRWFTPKDDAPKSPETMMLSYGYWQARFGGDSGVVGRRILVTFRRKNRSWEGRKHESDSSRWVSKCSLLLIA
jgi:hypothetical protein